MANSIFKKWKRFAGCALFAVCSLHAASGPKIVAKVPFDFVVRNQKMAAGEYTISIDSLRTVILVRGEADNSAVFTLTTAAESGKINVDPKLVFRRYGDRFFLSQVRGLAVEIPGWDQVLLAIPIRL
ncbi:MAG: hypothetical protein LAP39_28325 [Acidobacteriia bacterium]|nr:hypothetical protein [Terriglobia bacterium]